MVPSFILAIYGAIVSTVALVWNILNAFSQFKGGFKVERQSEIKFGGPEGEIVASMSCKVTNIGRTSRYIAMPKLEYVNFENLSKSQLDGLALLQIESAQEYPKELKPGEVHSVNYDLPEYYEKVIKSLPFDTRLCFHVLDTHGKKYSSEHFTAGKVVSEVLGCREMSRAILGNRSQ